MPAENRISNRYRPPFVTDRNGRKSNLWLSFRSRLALAPDSFRTIAGHSNVLGRWYDRTGGDSQTESFQLAKRAMGDGNDSPDDCQEE